jgi:UDP-2,3-diacylglucosamine hydrolase
MADEYLFISDCHLHASRPEVSGALIDFLNVRATGARYLYILGDLFEVWLGDDDPAEQLGSVIDALQVVTQSCEVFFMAGNRDFLLGEKFARRVGMTLLGDSESLQLGNQSIVLIHGDSLCTDDLDYQAFRKMVRGAKWQSEFLARPLPERQQIALQLRRDSADAMTQKSMDIMDVADNAVAACFGEFQVDGIIHGHTHRPAIHQYQSGLTRYVLGDWNPGPSFLSWAPAEGFKLVDARVKGY